MDGFSNGKSRCKMMHDLDLIFRLLFKISDKVMMVKKINESENFFYFRDPTVRNIKLGNHIFP